MEQDPKQWFMINFSIAEVADQIGMHRVMAFANKHNLKPEDFKIGPKDEHGIITVLYYSTEPLFE